MIDKLIDLINALSYDKIFVANVANGSSHFFAGTSFVANSDIFGLDTPKSERLTYKGKIKYVFKKMSGYVASMGVDIDHLYGGILHTFPLGILYDVGMSTALSLPFKGKRKNAFCYHFLQTQSHRLIDNYQTYGFNPSADFYITIIDNSKKITGVILSAMVAMELVRSYVESKKNDKKKTDYLKLYSE